MNHRRPVEVFTTPLQQRDQAEAILACVRRKLLSDDLGAGGEEVHQADRFITTTTRGNPARPPHQEGDPMSGFPNVGLGSAPAGIRAMMFRTVTLDGWVGQVIRVLRA